MCLSCLLLFVKDYFIVVFNIGFNLNMLHKRFKSIIGHVFLLHSHMGSNV